MKKINMGSLFKEDKHKAVKLDKKLSIPAGKMSFKKIPMPKAKKAEFHKPKEEKLRNPIITDAPKHSSGWM